MQGISGIQGVLADIVPDCSEPESNVSVIRGKQDTEGKRVAKTEATDAGNAICAIDIRERNLKTVRPDHSTLNESVPASDGSACNEKAPVTDVTHNRSLSDISQEILGLLRIFNGNPMNADAKAKLAALILHKSVIEVAENSGHPNSITGLGKTIDGVLTGDKEDETIFRLWKLSDNNRRKWVSGNEASRGYNSMDSLLVSLSKAAVEQEGLVKEYIDPYLQFLCDNGFSEFCKKIKGVDIFESINKIESNKNRISTYIKDYELFKQEKKYLDRVKKFESLIGAVNNDFVVTYDYFLTWFYLAQEVNSAADFYESRFTCGQMSLDDEEVGDLDLTLTSLESKILAAYLLYKQDNDGSIHVSMGKRIALYFDQLQDEFSNRIIDEYQYKILLSILAQNLGRFINELNCHKIRSKPVKAKGKRSANPSNAIVINSELKGAINLLLLMIQNKALQLISFSGIEAIVSVYLPHFRAGDSKHKIILNTIRDEMLKKAAGKDELVAADFMAICFSELNQDVDAFNSYLENSTKHSLIALLIIITNNLGLNKWPYTTVNPDLAVDYLISLKEKVDELSLMRPLMNKFYDFCISISANPAAVPEVWSVRLAIYFYLLGEADKGHKIVSLCKLPADKFYPALEKVASRDYFSAIGMLDDQRNQKGSAKALDARIKMLLAVLYERFSDSQEEVEAVSGTQVNRLEKAISFLKKVVSSRKELYKNLARVYEKNGSLSDSLSSWGKYRDFLKRDVEYSSEQCPSRYSNDIELRLVDEKIHFLREIIAVAEENTDPSINNDELLPGLCTDKKETMTLDQSELQPEKPINMQSNPETSAKNAIGDLSGPEKNQPAVSGVALSEQCTEKPDRLVIAKITEARAVDAGSDSTIIMAEQSGTILAAPADKDWRVVSRKKIKPPLSRLQAGPVISDELTEAAVTEALRASFFLRRDLNSRFLNLDGTEQGYDDLMQYIDKLTRQSSHPIAMSHFIQNKEWLLRMQSLNSGVMIIKSRRNKCSVNQTKSRIRGEIFASGKKQLANLYGIGCHPLTDDNCKDMPKMLQSKELTALLDHVCLHYKVQLGSHAATIAHTLNDIVSDEKHGLVSSTDVKELYQRNTQDCHSLARDYYGFRNFVNPEHKSDVI